jgi:hypothetical protein
MEFRDSKPIYIINGKPSNDVLAIAPIRFYDDGEYDGEYDFSYRCTELNEILLDNIPSASSIVDSYIEHFCDDRLGVSKNIVYDQFDKDIIKSKLIENHDYYDLFQSEPRFFIIVFKNLGG